MSRQMQKMQRLASMYGHGPILPAQPKRNPRWMAEWHAEKQAQIARKREIIENYVPLRDKCVRQGRHVMAYGWQCKIVRYEDEIAEIVRQVLMEDI